MAAAQTSNVTMPADLVGLPHGDFPLVWTWLRAGMTLDLHRDPHNSHDSNAIGVWLPQNHPYLRGARISAQPRDARGWRVGYLKAPDAKKVAPVMDAGHAVGCVLDEQPRGDDVRILRLQLSGDGLAGLKHAAGTPAPQPKRAPKRARSGDRIRVWL